MIKNSIPIEEMIRESDKIPIVFFGAGRYLEMILSNSYCRSIGLFSRVSYLLDNNDQLWGKESSYDEILCSFSSPNVLLNLPRCHVVITSQNYKAEISGQLEEMNCPSDYCIWDEIYDLYCENELLSGIILENSFKKPVIPKILHYCWFGDKEIPPKEKACINGWKEVCQDYEIIFWNEDNFDININRYVREAYNSKKYAFVSDYLRLWTIYHYGGIYVDTDVEILKNLNCFLSHEFFSGFESRNYIPTGVMGGKKKNRYTEYLLEYYKDRSFIVNNKPDLTTNVATITNMTIEKYGIELCNNYLDFKDCVFYPQEVFCPLLWSSGEKNITKNTYAIHWFSGSWG